MAVYVAHDTTISSLFYALGLDKGNEFAGVPFGGMLVFEVYRVKGVKKIKVRTEFAGVEMRVAGKELVGPKQFVLI